MAFKVRHLAIVLDGNRRYAKKLGLQPWKGHEFGINKLEELFKWCIELGIKELTLYSFSTENFKRDKKEINFLFSIFRSQFRNIRHKKGIFKDKIRVNFIGRLSMFPSDIRSAMMHIIEDTKKNKALKVNFAMAYGGKQEIVDAVKKIAALIKNNKINPNNINEKTITNNIYLKNEPELVIRPGGQIRTSNFLTWQSVYSEWVFASKLWPEFTKHDLVACIEEFSKRERRFGK